MCSRQSCATAALPLKMLPHCTQAWGALARVFAQRSPQAGAPNQGDAGVRVFLVPLPGGVCPPFHAPAQTCAPLYRTKCAHLPKAFEHRWHSKGLSLQCNLKVQVGALSEGLPAQGASKGLSPAVVPQQPGYCYSCTFR